MSKIHPEVEWITPDGYQIEDVLAMRRCIICAHLAGKEKVQNKYGTEYYLCDKPECKTQLTSVLAVLDA